MPKQQPRLAHQRAGRRRPRRSPAWVSRGRNGTSLAASPPPPAWKPKKSYPVGCSWPGPSHRGPGRQPPRRPSREP